MTQSVRHLSIVVGVIGAVGCSHSPTGPESGRTTASTSTVWTTPPIRGLVREVSGGPIAGVTVGLRSLQGVTQKSPTVISDQAGVFLIPPSTELCQASPTVALDISHRSFRFPAFPSIACSPNPPEVQLELKGQRGYTLASGAPVDITVSNDDVNWITDDNGYSCGPCKIVELTFPPQTAATIHVEWSGPAPIHLWVEGDRYAGDLVRLREVIPSPGDMAADINMLAEWRDLYLVLKIGLPYGGRFPATASQVPVRIEMR